MPSASVLQSPVAMHSQWPTPGVAYVPMPHMQPQYTQSPYMQPQHTQSPALDASRAEVAELTAKLAAATGEIERLASIMRGVQQPMPYGYDQPYVPLGLLTAPSMARPSPSRSATSFATITSSTSEATGDADGVEEMLPIPAAATHVLAAGRATACNDIFTSKELQSLLCNCEPDSVAEWDTTFLGRVASRCPAAYKALMYSDAEISVLPPSALALVRGYDSILAGHILAVIQGDTPEVKLVRKRIAARESSAPGCITGSGRALRAIILETITPTSGPELQELEDELEKPFFKMKMNNTAVKLAAHRLEALRAQLPPSARGGRRELLRALISKFPPELAAEAKKYKAKMAKNEIRKKPYSWTYAELTSILAADIAAASSVPAEANTADTPSSGGLCGPVGTVDFTGCLNCGLTNHTTKKCTTAPCTYCGLRFCYGIRHQGKKYCLVKKIVDGGAIEDSDVGLNGRPLAGHLQGWIKERAEKIKKEKSAKEANSTETQTVTIKGGIDDESSCGESD